MLLCILGRQPELCLAELESVVGPDRIKPIGAGAALVDVNGALNQKGLGGTIKIAKLLKEVDSTEINRVFLAVREAAIENLSIHSAHKQAFGISVYGMQVSARRISDLSFSIKKILKAKSVPVRAVISKSAALNSAQVLHNGLTGVYGNEFVVVSDRHRSYVAKTISVQDIDDYSKRDYGRPWRNTRVGMLPPKLAQIMINLTKAESGLTILDPFCGTGTVLIEAVLMGLKVEGSDVNKNMADQSIENLKWIEREYGITTERSITCADATIQKWKRFDRVVTETYLGPQLPRTPDRETMHRIVMECNSLISKFLINLRPQLDEHARCCMAVPAWPLKNEFIHLPVIKRLEYMGYSVVKFRHINAERLIYMRPGQAVARELLILVPKRQHAAQNANMPKQTNRYPRWNSYKHQETIL